MYPVKSGILTAKEGILMTMTISIDPATEKQLNLVASLTNSDKNTVLKNLISDSVAEKLNRLAAVQEGLDDIAAGRTVDHDEAIRGAMAAIDKAAAGRP
jgi:predicted transcriptional regulator